MTTFSDDTLRAIQDYAAALKADPHPCPDPGPCLNGPDPHQWHPSCQPGRDSAW